MLKSIGLVLAFMMSLSLLTGCGSSSSSGIVYDSGLSSGSHVADVAKDVTVEAYDSESNRVLAKAVVKAGTLLLDDNGAPIDTDVTYKLVANSEKVSDTAIKTVALLQVTDADGKIVEELSEEVPITLYAPKLKSMGTAKAESAVIQAVDASGAASLRGADVVIAVKPDGSISFSITYKAGRTWKISWTYVAEDGPVTGSTGGN